MLKAGKRGVGQRGCRVRLGVSVLRLGPVRSNRIHSNQQTTTEQKATTPSDLLCHSFESMDEESEAPKNPETSEAPETKELSEAPKQNRVRKRPKKRRRDDGKERRIEIKKERFDKLLYQANKDLQKHAKQCRTFLVQKSIRQIKKQGENTASSPSSSRLQSIKELPVERVVEQAVRQLGLLHANPDPEAIFTPPKPLTPELKSQVDMVLTHTRFQKVLEEWHKKVTEYRRWALNFDDRIENRQNPKKETVTTTMRSKNQPISVFCSLNEDDTAADGNEISPYGPGAFMEEVPVKKNRKGQRARRAKARALEAKKEGKKYESLNWRSAEEKHAKNKKVEEEQPEEEENNHPSWAAKRNEPSGIVEFKGTKVNFGEGASENKSEPPAENHPSWEAKKAQKSGIVAFQGTKITF